MNQLIESHLEYLAEAVENMTRMLESAHARIDEQKREKAEMQLAIGARNRKISILEENLAELDKVREENRRLQAKQSQAAEHAAKLLAHVRELQGKFTP